MYGQGKVEWSIDYLKMQPDFRIIQTLPEIADNDNKKTVDSLWGELRVAVLKEIFQNYFPKSEPIPSEYFDVNQRDTLRRKKNQLEKQKKLKKFFGEHLNDSQLHRQRQSWHVDTRPSQSRNSDSPLTTRMSDIHSEAHTPVVDKRKKVEKLTSFFGIPIPNEKIVLHTGEPSFSDQDTLLNTLNNLPPEEKLNLTKRAKKLLALLGENVEQDVLKNTLLIKTKLDKTNKELTASVDSLSMSRESYSPERIDPKEAQKKRLDRLTHKLGDRIQEKDMADTSNVIPTRKLNKWERKLFQKKALKLEQLFGHNVPVEAILNYDSAGSAQNSEMESSSDDTTGSRQERDEEVEEDLSPTTGENKQSQIARLRKIRKTFGVDSAYSPRAQEPPGMDVSHSKSSSSPLSPKLNPDTDVFWKA